MKGGNIRDIPIDVRHVPQPKYWGMYPRHPRRGWCSRVGHMVNLTSRSSNAWRDAPKSSW